MPKLEGARRSRRSPILDATRWTPPHFTTTAAVIASEDPPESLRDPPHPAVFRAGTGEAVSPCGHAGMALHYWHTGGAT